MHTHTYTNIHTNMLVYIHKCRHTYTEIQYIHTHIHKHIHT